MKHIALVTFLATSVVVSTMIPTRTEAAPDADHGTMYSDVSSQLSFARNADGFTDGLGGAAWLDYDNDGDLDVYLVNGVGAANGLFRNDGGTFADVTAAAGVANIGGASAGAVAADIDNDGCTDLFVHGAGGIGGPAFIGQPHVLYVNNCDGTFTDVTAGSGITGPHPAMMAAFGDINNDGYLDLFVTNPGSFVTGLGAQALYLNLGNLTRENSGLAGFQRVDDLFRLDLEQFVAFVYDIPFVF
ncbi:MAG: VCBS repeat-containing protein, partial [Pseudomonadota bacterium]